MKHTTKHDVLLHAKELKCCIAQSSTVQCNILTCCHHSGNIDIIFEKKCFASNLYHKNNVPPWISPVWFKRRRQSVYDKCLSEKVFVHINEKKKCFEISHRSIGVLCSFSQR